MARRPTEESATSAPCTACRSEPNFQCIAGCHSPVRAASYTTGGGCRAKYRALATVSFGRALATVSFGDAAADAAAAAGDAAADAADAAADAAAARAVRAATPPRLVGRPVSAAGPAERAGPADLAEAVRMRPRAAAARRGFNGSRPLRAGEPKWLRMMEMMVATPMASGGPPRRRGWAWLGELVVRLDRGHLGWRLVLAYAYSSPRFGVPDVLGSTRAHSLVVI